jgi:AraC-like DNA-binding protein
VSRAAAARTTTKATSRAPSPSLPTRAWSLGRFVEDIETVAPLAGQTLDVDRLPDGRTTLVFRVFDGGRQSDLAVAGPRTSAHFKHATGVTRAISWRFRPGYSSVLSPISASALTDRIVPLTELWGPSAEDLCADLRATSSFPAMLARLTQALVARAHGDTKAGTEPSFETTSARLARRAVHLFEGDPDRLESVEAVADRLGVSSRHLRRVFTENVGVGPKDFARSVRLQRAVQRTKEAGGGAHEPAHPHDWARIAAEAGYYDQAHLITDFRRLVGLTPGAFVKRVDDRRRVPGQL